MVDPDLSLLLDAVHRDQSDRTLKLVAADRAAELGLLSCERLLRYTARPSFTRPLLSTGSRVYGTPGPASDWDWVVFSVGSTTRSWFKGNYDYSGRRIPDHDATIYPPDMIESRLAGSYRFGPVNVIHVDQMSQYFIWREGTDQLLAESALEGPRTRERAIEVFTKTMDGLLTMSLDDRRELLAKYSAELSHHELPFPQRSGTE